MSTSTATNSSSSFVYLNSVLTREVLLKAMLASPVPLDAKALTAALIAAGGEPKQAESAWNNGSCDLKYRGLATMPSRGMWTISDLGREFLKGGMDLPPSTHVRVPRGAASPAPAPGATLAAAGTTPPVVAAPAAPVVAVAPAPEPAPVVVAPVVVAPVAEAPAPVVTAPAPAPDNSTVEAPAKAATAPKRRLKVADAPVVPAVPVPEWFQDDALRTMVADQTDCFASWSARSAECGKCPLAGWCRNAKAAALTMLAGKLTVADPANPGTIKAAVAKLDAAVDNAAQTAKVVPNPSQGTMSAKFDAVCVNTGKPIKKGDAVVYVTGKGLALANT